MLVKFVFSLNSVVAGFGNRSTILSFVVSIIFTGLKMQLLEKEF